MLSEADKARQAQNVFQQVQALPSFVRATTVLAYWSMPDELSTHEFIKQWCTSKTIILPVVDGDILRLKRFDGEHTLVPGFTLGILEPQGPDFTLLKNIEVAIVPGIAFDHHYRRLGRGKGYYDQLLPTLKSYNIGVGFDCQLFESIPFDEHDVPMDTVITG